MPQQGPLKARESSTSKLQRRKEERLSQYSDERRIVTALCYDLVASTDLFQRLDIEDFRELMAAFQHAAKSSITAYSGAIRAQAGDGGLALFPIEIDAKDAASLAIRAGLEIVEACRRVGREAGRNDLHVRVGIATSIALIQPTESEDWTREPVTGAALAMATRLEAIAAPDAVFVSQETRNLARRSHAFTFQGAQTLKGFAEPENVWRATGHKKEVDRFYAFGKLGGPFIGRLRELGTIAQCWEKVVEGRGEVLLIEGDAGIGKSRLLHEARRITRTQRSKLVLFQCLPGGLRSTLHPLRHSFPGRMSEGGGQLPLDVSNVATLFERNGIHDTEVIEIFAYLLGAQGRNQGFSNSDPKAIREKARRAVLRALEAMCSSGPLIIVVEDVHWIDPSSQDLLAVAARFVHQLPALLVVTSRLDSPMDWLEGSNPTRISLRPLDRDETRLAIRARWPEHRLAVLPEFLDVTERVSGGLPLFIEEICQWVSESLEPDTMKITGAVSPTHVSAFEGILDARLFRLGPARDVARAGAVAGARFNVSLLRALLPDFGKKSLRGALNTLCAAGFLRRVRAPGTIVYGFRHALIQEMIYNAQLRKPRQTLHRRLFAAVSQDREIAAWIDSGALAEHAERAALLESAVDLFVIAGKESSSRSAMVEARQYIEHALDLCNQLGGNAKVETLQLSALTALGPILTGTVGLNSPPARKLYEDGVAIARRQPMEEQSKWFPIYWGWWLTGSDFRVMHDRALQVQAMLSEVDDPEIRLQVKHCIWAIDFNLGRHRETQEAITAGLALYDEQLAKTSRTLFGGHDAKVCGLGQRALSLWLTGQSVASDQALAEMIAFVDKIAHVPSKAHSLDTEAVSAFYREDFGRLTEVTKNMMDFSKKHEMQSLAGLSLLFGGWARARTDDLASGHEIFREGFSVLKRLGAVADLPIYLDMHATILELNGKLEQAIEVVDEAIAEAQETGHAYWVAELHRRRAVIHARQGRKLETVRAELRSAHALATTQGALALAERAEQSAQEFGINLEV
jgi:predicted ATPase/class 3 adenylate cyclase